MSTTTYLRRKAAGRCPTCGDPTTPPYVCCPACRATARLIDASAQQADHIRHLQARFDLSKAEATALEARLREAKTWPQLPRPVVSDSPGALLACCGTWQAVTTLPHRCPTCGLLYLTRSAPALRSITTPSKERRI
jgi:hypothetical protein